MPPVLHLQKKVANATFRNVAYAALGGTLMLSCLPAHAEGLPDPTRPPPGFVDPADPESMAPATQGSALTPGADALVLQSVMLPQHGKPVAIINGEYVPLGARIAGWELKSVSEREVLLIQGGNRRQLRLLPLAVKLPVANASSTKDGDVPVKRKVKKLAVKESESKQ